MILEPVRDHLGRFSKWKRASCPQCEVLVICNVPCHEAGCPEAWKDEERECRECGYTFRPEEREQRYCSPCCSALAFGETCFCEQCERFREEQAD